MAITGKLGPAFWPQPGSNTHHFCSQSMIRVSHKQGDCEMWSSTGMFDEQSVFLQQSALVVTKNTFVLSLTHGENTTHLQRFLPSLHPVPSSQTLGFMSLSYLYYTSTCEPLVLEIHKQKQKLFATLSPTYPNTIVEGRQSNHKEHPHSGGKGWEDSQLPPSWVILKPHWIDVTKTSCNEGKRVLFVVCFGIFRALF